MAIRPLREEQSCSVCRDLYSNPRPLPCGHSFCPTCSRGVWSQGVEGHFSCPQCVEEGIPVPCDSCPGDPAVAVKTCLRCEVSLCAEHLRPHLDCLAFRAHQLVEPLTDVAKRKCPEHDEMFRYYCMDEQVYVCADCVLEGGHTQHQVMGLRKIEDDLKVTLQRLLQEAEGKLRESKRRLREQNAANCTLMETSSTARAQIESLGLSLEARVKCFVSGLKESVLQEKQRALLQLRDNYSRVTVDLNRTYSVRKHLCSLLEETDPFLLVWAFQFEDKKLNFDLDTPLFIPEPVSLDSKNFQEAIESRSRQFISETLQCLIELRRQFSGSPLTMDTNSAHPLLSVSDDLRSVVRVRSRLPCSAHPDRFDHWAQVLTTQSFSSGKHYWEVEAEGFWDVAVSYRSIGRKGKEGTAFGANRLSWSLMQQGDGTLAAWHNKRKTRLGVRVSGHRVAVSLDYAAGTVAFCEVGPALTHLHTFKTSFSQPVHLGFGLYKAELNSRISIVKMSNTKNPERFEYC